MRGFNIQRKKWVFTAMIILILGLIVLYSNIYQLHVRVNPSIRNTFRSTQLGSLPVAPQPRVLCLILASPKYREKMEAVNKTWAKRCDIPIFILSKTNNKEQKQNANASPQKNMTEKSANQKNVTEKSTNHKNKNIPEKSTSTKNMTEKSADHKNMTEKTTNHKNMAEKTTNQFISTQKVEGIFEVDAPDNRLYLPKKVQMAFEYAYRRYNNQFDWILKCDDDTYVIMENLKLLLSRYDPNKPLTLGYRFKPSRGFMSGGAGYLLSSSGIRNVIEIGYKLPECQKRAGHEDVEMGRCFNKSGVQIVDSLDNEGKETFHPEPYGRYLYPQYPHWLGAFGWHRPVFGLGCCSRHAITFHHLKPPEIFLYETLLYNTSIG